MFSEIGLPVWQARILGTAQICSLIAMWSDIWSAMRKLSCLGFGKAKGTSEISGCLLLLGPNRHWLGRLVLSALGVSFIDEHVTEGGQHPLQREVSIAA